MKMNKEVVMVKISDIVPNRFQPRLAFDEEALNELASSIKEHGIIQPLILRDLGNKYEIIAGERRYKASALAGLTEVPAIIGSMDDQTSAELALIENIQRKDLTAIEEAISYKKILEMGNFTQEQLAKRMGKSQSTIANKMRLLSLTNEVQAALKNSLISERHARCLLQIKDEDLQKQVLNKIITERINVRDTDEYVKKLLGISKETPVVPENTNHNIDLTKPVDNVVNPLYENNMPEQKIELPEEENTNPNVYTQTKNIDFVNIDNLTNSEITPLNLNKNIEMQERTIDDMPNQEITPQTVVVADTPSLETPKPSNMDRLKYATAIKITEDAVENIKSAGYQVQLEEVNNETDYQIIIKILK